MKFFFLKATFDLMVYILCTYVELLCILIIIIIILI
jgi:hypothetical protein